MVMQQRWQGREYEDRGDWQSNSRGQGMRSSGSDGRGLAQALGWFSLGLGLAQIAMPRGVAKMIGVRDDEQATTVMRALGAREIATGVGLLMNSRSAGWVKARVGGDIMDLALLGKELASDNTDRDKAALATLAVVGVTVVDIIASERLSSAGDGGYIEYQAQSSGRQSILEDHRQENDMNTGASDSQTQKRSKADGIHVKKSITINSGPEELYTFWRSFGNLPQVMSHVESITEVGERQSHWEVKAPGGMTVQWDAEIITDEPNVMISWQSLPHADVDNFGSVRFKPAPGGKGTEVQVELKYKPPAGVLGATIAKFFGEEPEQQIQDDLRHFKQIMETGEVIVSDATVEGNYLLKQRSARPPEQVPQSLGALPR